MNDYNNFELIGGNNQKVYRAKNGYSDSVIKVLEPELHADSPHHDWNVDERIERYNDCEYPFEVLGIKE